MSAIARRDYQPRCTVPGCGRKQFTQGLCPFHCDSTPGLRQRKHNIRGWSFARNAWARRYRGHDLRVTAEDAGYRLWIDGHRRGFYDSVSYARTHGVHLVTAGYAAHPKPSYSRPTPSTSTGASR